MFLGYFECREDPKHPEVEEARERSGALLRGGVHAGRVVRAGVEQDHGSLLHGRDVREHAVEVEAARGRVVVLVPGPAVPWGPLKAGKVVEETPSGRQNVSETVLVSL